MPKHDFLVNSPGGFLEPLPDSACTEIERRFSKIPPERIRWELGWYVNHRQALEGQPPPKELRQGVEDFLGQVKAMLPIVETMSRNNIGARVRDASEPFSDELDNLLRSLRVLNIALPRVIDSLPKGHARSAREVMVANVAGIVASAGLTADARPNGPVCQIVGIVLRAAKESSSNVPSIVRPVIAALKKTG